MSMNDSGNLKDLAVVGIDIGKDIFHLVGFDSAGELVLRKMINRLALNQTFEKLPQCVVGMEACLSAPSFPIRAENLNLWVDGLKNQLSNKL